MARSYGIGLGSDQRFQPKWWQRKAYAAGLIDANRIVEDKTWEPARSPKVREAQRAVHDRAVEVSRGRFYDEA